METTNLTLGFTVPGQEQVRFTKAARIRIDGEGGVQVFGPRGGPPARIAAANLSFLVFREGAPGTAPKAFARASG